MEHEEIDLLRVMENPSVEIRTVPCGIRGDRLVRVINYLRGEIQTRVSIVVGIYRNILE